MELLVLCFPPLILELQKNDRVVWAFQVIFTGVPGHVFGGHGRSGNMLLNRDEGMSKNQPHSTTVNGNYCFPYLSPSTLLLSKST